MALTLDDVIGQMRERGIEPPAKLDVDGKKYTWAGDPRKPKKKNAWCVLHEWTSPKSGRTYLVGRYGIRDAHWAVEPTQVEWSPAEKTAWLERRKAIEKEAEEDRKQQAALAAEKAEKLWARARLEGGSEYLQRKQVGAYGVRFAFGSVVVPLFDLAGKLHGLQWIGKDGGKTFGTGTVKEGHFHLIGDVSDGMPVGFAEGYATAASVHMATGWPVVVCFDAGNLMPVIAAWRKLYPDHEFIIAADDDRHLVTRLCERLERAGVGAKPADFAKSAGGLRDMRWDLPDGMVVELKARWVKDRAEVFHIEGSIRAGDVPQMLKLENAGRAKAFAAAKRHTARVILPRFADRSNTGTDWNDLHVNEGLQIARQQLLAEPPAAQRKNGQPPGGGGSNSGSGDGDYPQRLRFPYLTDKWEPKGIRENVYFALTEDPALRELVRYNDFSQQIDRVRPAPWNAAEDEHGQWRTMDDLRLANYLASRHNVIVGNPVTIEQAVMMAAYDARHNPVREHFEALAWDGVERLRHWMIECLGAPDTEYTACVSRWFLMSMVARVYEPGCQMDYMLVLQGGQGARKSTVLQLLAGEYYGAGSFRVGDKDSLQALQGRLLFNFNELDALNRAESTAIKGFITERTDRFRPPYGKDFQPFPRTCVLTGDTNQNEFLRDPTGDRRFWVVHCSDIDVDKMRDWHEQLLAEATHLYKQGERRYPTREEEERLFRPEQDKWKFVDVWHDALERYVHSLEVVEGYVGCKAGVENIDRDFFSTHELLVKALHIDIGKIDRAGTMQRSVGNAMKLMGWEADRWKSEKDRDESGQVRPRGYRRPAPKPKDAQALAQPVQGEAQQDEVPEWD